MPEPEVPQDIFLENAVRPFIDATSTESAEHIKPLHRYLAMRFVVEGGFDPADLMPRPPLAATFRDGRWLLSFEPLREGEKEQVVLGALKSKRIDLVVTKEGIGPVLAVSVKGTSRAFRNLVNRTEEAIGDCANIHLMHPGLVYGFILFLKAIDPGDKELRPNDISLDGTGNVVPAVRAYAKILEGLTGRRLVRNDYARYEAVGLALLATDRPGTRAPLFQGFPEPESPLGLSAFFGVLYGVYDFRYPYTYTDPSLRGLVRREWDPRSPALLSLGGVERLAHALGYTARVC